MYDLTVSIVNFNSDQELSRCLESFYSYAPDLKYKITVVDNNSEKSPRYLSEKFPDVEFILNSRNIGFGKANNAAIKKDSSKYHLILNPDIIFTNNCIEKLVAYMDENEAIGLIAPRLTYEDGRLQYSCRRFPTVFSFIQRGMKGDFKSKVMDEYLMRGISHEKIMKVDWVLGSFMLARKDLLDELNGFDEKFFMYYEDIDLCYRIKNKRYDVVYYGQLEVMHQYKRESAKSSMLGKLRVIHASSALRFFWRYLPDRKWRTIR